MSIEVSHLSKRLGGFQAVEDVSFQIETGSLTALLGPSGCGKSTLLRLIAGLEIPDQGDVTITGVSMTGQSAQVRNVGFVFQHFSLFKHMTVWDNIAFGLQVRKISKNEIQRRVEELVNLVMLNGLELCYPAQLSGGQRQRVALARALAPRPQILLLDEPFGSLDARVREELRAWLKKLHDDIKVTTLFVTHDQFEAFEISRRILVMNQGRIEQEGSPDEICSHPATPFVTEFVAGARFVEIPVTQPGEVQLGATKIVIPGAKEGEKIRLFYRPFRTQ